MEERTLKKVSGSSYELVVENKEAKLTTTKGYERSELKEIVMQLNMNKDNLLAQRRKLEAQIGGMDVEETPALKELVEKLKGAQQLMEKEKLEVQLGQVKTDIVMLGGQVAEIIKAVPELVRGKK